MEKETIFCYHCEKAFYVDSFRLREAKTISCLYCGKRIDRIKAIFEGEKRCSNCNARQQDHVDFYDGMKPGSTCPMRKSMKFLEKGEEDLLFGDKQYEEEYEEEIGKNVWEQLWKKNKIKRRKE